MVLKKIMGVSRLSDSTSSDTVSQAHFLKTRAAVLQKAEQVKDLNDGFRDLDGDSDQVTLLGARLDGDALTDLLGGSGKYSGAAQMVDGQVIDLSLESQPTAFRSRKSYRYAELEDGSKLYVAPSDDDGQHRLVVEQANGTLLMETRPHSEVDDGVESLLSASGIPSPESNLKGVQGTPWLSLFGQIAEQAKNL